MIFVTDLNTTHKRHSSRQISKEESPKKVIQEVPCSRPSQSGSQSWDIPPSGTVGPVIVNPLSTDQVLEEKNKGGEDHEEQAREFMGSPVRTQVTFPETSTSITPVHRTFWDSRPRTPNFEETEKVVLFHFKTAVVCRVSTHCAHSLSGEIEDYVRSIHA
jgi:hypothetical protein